MEKTVTKPTDWPDLAGRLTESGHVLPVRVYYEDTDFSGLVYHASYVRFLERGRSDWLRLLGVGHEALARGEFGATSLAFAVARMTIDFKKPARIDEALAIETHVKAIGGAIIKLTQTVRREESVLVTAEVSVVLVNAAGKPQRIPRDLLQALSKRS